jgi:probable rRNA maturation factor
MEIEVSVSSDEWSKDLTDAESLARTAAAATIRQCVPTLLNRAGEVTVTLADDQMLNQLNQYHRQKDGPTNVLSFPMMDGAGELSTEVDILLGDVIIAHGVTAREARESEKEIADHLSHLVVHGVLHLLGYDHEDDEEATEMEKLEVEILKSLNIADPYS